MDTLQNSENAGFASDTDNDTLKTYTTQELKTSMEEKQKKKTTLRHKALIIIDSAESNADLLAKFIFGAAISFWTWLINSGHILWSFGFMVVVLITLLIEMRTKPGRLSRYFQEKRYREELKRLADRTIETIFGTSENKQR